MKRAQGNVARVEAAHADANRQDAAVCMGVPPALVYGGQRSVLYTFQYFLCTILCVDKLPSYKSSNLM
eukprot:2056967-Amphidinium_carterae.1